PNLSPSNSTASVSPLPHPTSRESPSTTTLLFSSSNPITPPYRTGSPLSTNSLVNSEYSTPWPRLRTTCSTSRCAPKNSSQPSSYALKRRPTRQAGTTACS
ncbi:hypothetical protein C0992_010488, partial [Termitomyces sp. T32_za158]